MARTKLNRTFQNRLIQASHEVGREDRQLAILGEGNISVSAGDGTFWIKSSGSSLGSLDATGVTQVNQMKILEALKKASLSDAGVREVLLSSRVDSKAKIPSVETFMHAACLSETRAAWVGHCHPNSVLQILCSRLGAAPFLRPLFPDGIVVCGRHVCVVPYLDPGFELALEVRKKLKEFYAEHSIWPKVILLLNHGPVVLAQSEQEMLSILLMLDKWARVLVGTCAVGGPLCLPHQACERIDTRPDEDHRRKEIAAALARTQP